MATKGSSIMLLAVTVAFFTLTNAAGQEELKLPAIFGSSMVVQQQKAWSIWGTTAPNMQVSVTLRAVAYPGKSDESGAWSVSLPPQQPSSVGTNITITDTQSTIYLTDVVFGDVYVCSGQSNMELGVAETANATTEIPQSTMYGEQVRLLMVGLEDAYCNVTTPQNDFVPAIPWARAAPENVGGMSALCYYYGIELSKHVPHPIGLVHSSWGGTAIEVWMSPAALDQCYGTSPSASPPMTKAYPSDPGLSYLNGRSLGCSPSLHSTLYNSMIYPLVTIPLTGILWYQGEANANRPVDYGRCFPIMISDWRKTWTEKSGIAADTPFLFVQLSSWPAGDNGMIANQRFAQLAALKLPKVGMAVAADIGDPASAAHPIHPPWKQEVARRMVLTAQNIIYGNTSVPALGPVVSAVELDQWDASWGSYHHGYGTSNVCAVAAFHCLGIRIKFDRPLAIRPTYGLLYGFHDGFELWDATQTQFQPLVLTGVSQDGLEIQLNGTFIFGNPGVVRYAWHDYPTMPLVGVAAERPVPPFNITVSLSN